MNKEEILEEICDIQYVHTYSGGEINENTAVLEFSPEKLAEFLAKHLP